MSAPIWQLDGQFARSTGNGWSATVDVCRPFEGIGLHLGVGDGSAHASSPWRVFGVLLGDGLSVDASQLDAYVRGSDLVATYHQTASRQLRTQIYWRHLPAEEFFPSRATQITAAFDLIVSVNTPLLDCDPEAAVQTILPAAEVLNLRIDKDGRSHTRSLGTAPSEPASQATGCFIARPSGSQFSYVEIVHPVDYTASDITLGDSVPPRVRIVHQFFRTRLEKGVILRARMRAAVVARSGDEAIASDAYGHFATMEPPLTV